MKAALVAAISTSRTLHRRKAAQAVVLAGSPDLAPPGNLVLGCLGGSANPDAPPPDCLRCHRPWSEYARLGGKCPGLRPRWVEAARQSLS